VKWKILTLLLVLALSSGCSGLLGKNKGVIGKESLKTTAVAAKIEALEDKGAEINEKRLTSIGTLSVGVDYSLQKDTNQSQAVNIAKELNERVTALANKPDYKDLQVIYHIIDTMMTNQVNGEKLLASKDKEIISLNKSLEQVKKDTTEQIDIAFKQSAQNANMLDQYKQSLSDMDSFWGGGAIWYGLKKLVTKLMWVIGGCVALYFILRFAAAFNPIAATLFSVVSTIFSLFVKLIQSIAPRAVHLAGFIEEKTFEDYKGTLTHVIDAIRSMQEKEKLGVDVKMEDLLKEMAKSMDTPDKARMKSIEESLLWD